MGPCQQFFCLFAAALAAQLHTALANNATSTTTVTTTTTYTTSTTATATTTGTMTMTGTTTMTGTMTTTPTPPAPSPSPSMADNVTNATTMTLTYTVTVTDTTTATATTTATTTITGTTTATATSGTAPPAYKARITGEFGLDFGSGADLNAIMSNSAVRTGIAKGIAELAGVPDTWVVLTGLEIVAANRRLQMLQGNTRRLDSHSTLKVQYAIEIPTNAASQFTGSSVGASLETASAPENRAAFTQTINTKVEAATQSTDFASSVTNVVAPVVMDDTGTVVTYTTTTATTTADNSLTRTQVALTSAHALAIFVGMLSMQ